MFTAHELKCVFLPVSLAYRLHGGSSVLQYYRGPAAVVLGQRPQILCPAQRPWRDRPSAGTQLCPAKKLLMTAFCIAHAYIF